MAEEIPLGGNLQDAVRIGDTVHRRAGPWTPSVHELLRYLEHAGFPAPRVVGMDVRGREVLRYIEGEAHSGRRSHYRGHFSLTICWYRRGSCFAGTTTSSPAFARRRTPPGDSLRRRRTSSSATTIGRLGTRSYAADAPR